MNSNSDFNELWKKQTSVQPGAEIIMAKWKSARRSNLRRVWITNILFALTSLFIIWIWVSYDPQLFTTKTGIALVILSMGIYGMAHNSLKPLIHDVNSASSNKDYLEKLLSIKSRQKFLHTTMLNLYFVTLSVGLFLYLIEPTARMSASGRIVSYLLTFAWILFNWFYVRPRMIRKQETKIDEVISKFRQLTGNFEIGD